MGRLIREYIPEEPVTFTDWVDDDGLGNGPFKMVLTVWREGDVCHADWTGTDDQAPGSINFHIHEGLCKLFFGIYMIMAFDPQILFNDGLYDVFEVTLPGGVAAEPDVPRAAVQPAQRAHPLLRLPERGARPEGPGPLDGGGVRHEPGVRVLRGRPGRRVLPVRGAAVRRDPRPVDGDGLDGHSWWPLFRTTPGRIRRGLLPVVSSVYVPVRDSGGAGFTAAAPGSRSSTSSPAPAIHR